MRLRNISVFTGVVIVLSLVSCSGSGDSVVELERFSANTLEDLLTQTNVMIDKEITSDGDGSLRYSVSDPQTIRLFEVRNIDVDDARLIYQARLRTEDVQGQVYLEMWCYFPDKGEFFSRSVDTPLTGSTEWTTEETPFSLKKGENPDFVKLNLVFDGTGTVWIDDIRLLKVPLE